MLEGWRIVKRKHAANAFSGKGAADSGGRWNSPGIHVVYTSSSLALAALENLVHLNPTVIFEYVAFPFQFDEALLETFSSANLPSDWKEQPPPPSTKSIGDLWVRERRSCVLQLPSVIVPTDPNYLLNPAHPDFPQISIGKPEPFTFDPRLVPTIR